jgi:hypothetical protein
MNFINTRRGIFTALLDCSKNLNRGVGAHDPYNEMAYVDFEVLHDTRQPIWASLLPTHFISGVKCRTIFGDQLTSVIRRPP